MKLELTNALLMSTDFAAPERAAFLRSIAPEEPASTCAFAADRLAVEEHVTDVSCLENHKQQVSGESIFKTLRLVRPA